MTSEKDPLLSPSSSNASLYEALGLPATATAGEVRKAYFRLSLLVHPDRNPDDPDATKRFQSLQKIYGVLSDPEKRRLYDETGITDADDPDAFSEDRCASLRAFYRARFKPVTRDAIDDFKRDYQGSEEEVGDVLAYYIEFEGDMEEVFRHVMLSDVEADAARFVQMIEEGLADGRVAVRFETYEVWRRKMEGKMRKTKKARNGRRQGNGETKKTKRSNKRGGKEERGGVDDLAHAILARKTSSTRGGGGFADFAARFGVTAMDGDDPLGDDATFRAAQEQLLKRRKK